MRRSSPGSTHPRPCRRCRRAAGPSPAWPSLTARHEVGEGARSPPGLGARARMPEDSRSPSDPSPDAGGLSRFPRLGRWCRGPRARGDGRRLFRARHPEAEARGLPRRRPVSACSVASFRPQHRPCVQRRALGHIRRRRRPACARGGGAPRSTPGRRDRPRLGAGPRPERHAAARSFRRGWASARRSIGPARPRRCCRFGQRSVERGPRSASTQFAANQSSEAGARRSAASASATAGAGGRGPAA